jgi:p-aminobenzoyl-glutamate transporter AbgT
MPVGLARVVPPEGATISGVRIPGGVRLSHSPRHARVDIKRMLSRQALAKARFSCIYRRMYSFVPMTSCQSVGLGPRLLNWTSSWLLSQSDHEVVKELSKCIVSLLCFLSASESHCFDSLAYCELYLGLAHLFRRFDLRMDKSRCEFSHNSSSLA